MSEKLQKSTKKGGGLAAPSLTRRSFRSGRQREEQLSYYSAEKRKDVQERERLFRLLICSRREVRKANGGAALRRAGLEGAQEFRYKKKGEKWPKEWLVRSRDGESDARKGRKERIVLK